MTPLPALEAHALGVIFLTVLAFALFSRERLPLETTSVGVLALLSLGFYLFPYERDGTSVVPADFFLGFGHEALITICSLMVLGRALVTTGALEPVARRLGALLSAAPDAAMLGVLVLCAASSGVLNDTPIVVLMMPVLVSAGLRSGTSPARTLLPMNYAVLLGGMGTTIGTSTNLLVVAISADLGVPRFGMFDFVHVTALAAVGGIVYLWLVLPRLLRQPSSPLGDASPQVYSAVLHVRKDGYAEGKSLQEVLERAGGRLQVQKIVRGESLELMRLPSLALAAGDRLYVSASPQELQEYSSALETSLHNVDDEEHEIDEDHPLAAADQRLAEVVVTEASPLHGSTLRAARFSDVYGVVVVGVHRAGGAVLRRQDDLSDVRLRTGDVLLVQGGEEAIGRLRANARLLVLDRSLDLPRTAKAPLALLILGGVVCAAAFKLAPISVAALTGVVCAILGRCLDWEEAAAALSSKVILLVAASLALGAALTRTGATEFLAAVFVRGVHDLEPHWILMLLMLLMAALTNFISNNAAAAIGTPIAVSMAGQLGVAPEPLVLAILFGANFCYATPMAYQTNLLVMSAGGYSFRDFVRGGLPLMMIMLAAYGFLLPRFFPL